MNTTAEITQQLRLAAELIATLARDQDSLTAEQHAAVDAVLSGTTHEPPPFQLPPRPPGMRWHREDGWKAEDLPQGYRPHALGEIDQKGDQRKNGNEWSDCACATNVPSRKVDFHRRTARPLVFTHEGKQWTWHRPGDPMPCEPKALIEVVYGEHCDYGKAEHYNWDAHTRVFGWRYAKTTKTVELGPEDVPPGSILKANSWTSHEWRSVGHVYSDGVLMSNCPATTQWSHLMQDYQINRSIPLTGKWDANAWEPCHKTLANG
jgi:hypothetical protein